MSTGMLILIVGIGGAVLAVMIAKALLNKPSNDNPPPVNEQTSERKPEVIPPPPQPMKKVYWIHGISGDMKNRAYLLESELVFGRYQTCDICYSEQKKNVSRLHAKVYLKDGEVYLMDLGSGDGTYLNYNSKRLEADDPPKKLKNRDCFEIGTKKSDYFELVVYRE